MEEIQKLLEDLSRDNPKDVVDAAIDKLLHIDDEDVTILLKPVNKSCWENAAKVLKIIGYPRNQFALPGIIEWLRDTNWPGDKIAKEILFAIDKTVVIPIIEDALRIAAFESDYIWIACIKELVQEMGVTEEEFLNPKTLRLLNFEDLLSDIQF